MHYTSFLLSLALHCAIVLLVAFWPASPPVRLDMPVVQVDLVSLGAPGGPKAPPAPAPGPVQPQATPAPAPTASSPRAAPVATPEAPEKPAPRAEPRPAPKAEPKFEPKLAPTPEPKLDAKAISEKKDEQQARAEAPEPRKDIAQNATAAAPARPEPKRPEPPNPSDVLKRALADVRTKTGGAPERGKTRAGVTSGAAGARDVANALSALQASVKTGAKAGGGSTGGGDGSGGDGSGGVGIAGVYTMQVMQIVRGNWQFPALASRENLAVRVRVKIAPNGQIQDFNVEQPSGRADFDASALKALGKTSVLPPPPSPEFQDLVLNFNLQEMIEKR